MSVLEEEEEACVLDVGNVVTCTLKVGGVVEVVGVVVMVVVVILASIRLVYSSCEGKKIFVMTIIGGTA